MIVIIVIIGCTNKEIGPQQNNMPQYEKQQTIGLLKGVGVSPKNFEQNNFLDFLENVKQTQDILLWAGDWFEITEEKSPKIFTELAAKYDYIPIIEVGYYIQESGELLRPLNEENKNPNRLKGRGIFNVPDTPSDDGEWIQNSPTTASGGVSETNKQIYLDSTIDFVKKYKPKYFGIGVEVNIFAEKNPDAFEEFVPFYNEVYDAIKIVSPDTKVFTVFQLEKMKGLPMWKIEESKSNWELIDRFKTDIIAFTTYPGIFYKDVSDIPEDHYAEIKSYVSKPIAFTEIGWHSKDSPDGWESSEQEQAEFIKRFFKLTEDLEIEMAIWSFMYDQDAIEPFDSMGLINNDGTKKLSWYEWIGKQL